MTQTAFILMQRSVRKLASATWRLSNWKLSRKSRQVGSYLTEIFVSILIGTLCVAIPASKKSSRHSRLKKSFPNSVEDEDRRYRLCKVRRDNFRPCAGRTLHSLPV